MKKPTKRKLSAYTTYIYEDQVLCLHKIRDDAGVYSAFVVRKALDEYLSREHGLVPGAPVPASSDE